MFYKMLHKDILYYKLIIALYNGQCKRYAMDVHVLHWRQTNSPPSQGSHKNDKATFTDTILKVDQESKESVNGDEYKKPLTPLVQNWYYEHGNAVQNFKFHCSFQEY